MLLQASPVPTKRDPFSAAALFSLASVWVALGASGAASARDWPEWRGEGRGGVWVGSRLPARLESATVEERWRVPVGGGFSGVAVAGGKVFVMDRPMDGPHRERVLALDAATGKRLWSHAWAAEYGDLDYGKGPRATPTVRGGAVFALGAVGHLSCLDAASGAPRWSRDAVSELDARLPTWGLAASPLVHGKVVIAVVGARPDGTLVAFDRDSGVERWRALEDRPGYSSPVLARIHGQEQLVIWTADAAHGIDPATGGVHWSHSFRTSNYDVAIASPVVVDSEVFLSGYWDGTQLLRLSPTHDVRVVWESRLPSCLMSTPLVRDGHIYALDRREGVVCTEWASGELRWKDGHRVTPRGRNPHATMVWAGKEAVILNTPGELILARLSPEAYDERGRVDIIGETWAHPAFSGQDVFARDDRELVCVRLRSPGTSAETGGADRR